MSIFLNILFLSGGLAFLLAGASLLVSGGSNIAYRLGISVTIVGLTIISYGTSLPELVVSTASSISGSSELALGNVLGSNIANIGLILGTTALLSALTVKTEILRRDFTVLMIATAVFIFIILDGKVTRIEGIILMVSGFSYTVFLIHSAGKSRKNIDSEDSEKSRSLWLNILFIVSGISFLVIGGKLCVDNAVKLAGVMGISQKVIAITIVSIGTSLPELAASMVAAWHKKGEMALGNVVGSNIFNILFVLGTAAVISPFSIPSGSFSLIDITVLVFLTLMLGPVMYTGRRISKGEGAFLLISYTGYLAYLVIR
ncbi:MAG: calcium/sodium antiporter [Deltaproteobacteria bacterium]|nr:calcium/sodium antiporter [Deltaproteobacteria bacterium]